MSVLDLLKRKETLIDESDYNPFLSKIKSACSKGSSVLMRDTLQVGYAHIDGISPICPDVFMEFMNAGLVTRDIEKFPKDCITPNALVNVLTHIQCSYYEVKYNSYCMIQSFSAPIYGNCDHLPKDIQNNLGFIDSKDDLQVICGTGKSIIQYVTEKLDGLLFVAIGLKLEGGTIPFVSLGLCGRQLHELVYSFGETAIPGAFSGEMVGDVIHIFGDGSTLNLSVEAVRWGGKYYGLELKDQMCLDQFFDKYPASNPYRGEGLILGINGVEYKIKNVNTYDLKVYTPYHDGSLIVGTSDHRIRLMVNVAVKDVGGMPPSFISRVDESLKEESMEYISSLKVGSICEVAIFEPLESRKAFLIKQRQDKMFPNSTEVFNSIYASLNVKGFYDLFVRALKFLPTVYFPKTVNRHAVYYPVPSLVKILIAKMFCPEGSTILICPQEVVRLLFHETGVRYDSCVIDEVIAHFRGPDIPEKRVSFVLTHYDYVSKVAELIKKYGDSKQVFATSKDCYHILGSFSGFVPLIDLAIRIAQKGKAVGMSKLTAMAGRREFCCDGKGKVSVYRCGGKDVRTNIDCHIDPTYFMKVFPSMTRVEEYFQGVVLKISMVNGFLIPQLVERVLLKLPFMKPNDISYISRSPDFKTLRNRLRQAFFSSFSMSKYHDKLEQMISDFKEAIFVNLDVTGDYHAVLIN